jgi:hypothetical protein
MSRFGPRYKAVVGGVLVVASLMLTRAAEGEVPTAADFAACNAEAPQAIKAGTASPVVADHARADRARKSSATAAPRAAGLESSDPQIHGMETVGARDAAYQAAYRSCMRRKGF